MRARLRGLFIDTPDAQNASLVDGVNETDRRRQIVTQQLKILIGGFILLPLLRVS